MVVSNTHNFWSTYSWVNPLDGSVTNFGQQLIHAIQSTEISVKLGSFK